MIKSLLESIENGIGAIDLKLAEARSTKTAEYASLETRVAAELSDEAVESRLNAQRDDLLGCLDVRRRTDLRTLPASRSMTWFRASRGDALDLSRHVVYENGFSLHKKIAYMHLIPSRPSRYVDYDLYDIKYPHSAIKFSSLLTATRIFLLIHLSGSDYLLQTHQINRSSLATCKQLMKKSVFKYTFEFMEGRIVGAFNLRVVEIYDLDLNTLKRVDFITCEGRFLSYRRILTNGFEIIFDQVEFYRLYDRDLREVGRLGQTDEPGQAFYIDLNEDLELVNVSKRFLVYVTPERHCIRLISRDSGHYVTSFSLARLFDIPASNFYINLSFFVDFDTSTVYFKSDSARSIYCLDVDSNAAVQIQDEYVVAAIDDTCRFRALYDSETNFGEQTVLISKRNFSTHNLKIVYIF